MSTLVKMEKFICLSASCLTYARRAAYDPARCADQAPFSARLATYFVYDGWDLIEERNSSNAVLATYVHGVRSDEMLSRTTSSGTVYYHHNALGSVIDLTNASGVVIEKYKYDAFGKPAIFAGSGNPLTASAYGNRFLFTGREFLAEVNLYDYRNRVYSADLGRFLQTDPIRFSAGDVNLYRYCGNSSIDRLDSFGLDSVTTGSVSLPVGPGLTLDIGLQHDDSGNEQMTLGGTAGVPGADSELPSASVSVTPNSSIDPDSSEPSASLNLNVGNLSLNPNDNTVTISTNPSTTPSGSVTLPPVPLPLPPSPQQAGSALDNAIKNAINNLKNSLKTPPAINTKPPTPAHNCIPFHNGPLQLR